MNQPLSQIIKYFHDCYRSDNRDLVIHDFLDQKVENRIIIEGYEELINGMAPYIPISESKAERILKQLELFEKEKELLLGSLFVCGKYRDISGKVKRLCSPLYLYPIRIIRNEEFYFLSIIPGERRLNYPLLNMLSEDSSEHFLKDELQSQFSQDGLIRFEDVGLLIKLINRHFSKLNADSLYLYPRNTPVSELKKSISKISESDLSIKEIFPASMVGVVTKSSNTRGVLNELLDLAKNNSYSEPLNRLFTNEKIVIKPNTYQPGHIPIILSEPQQDILKSSSINPISVISGPPGTGKSFTIGAIAIEHMSRGESVLIASKTHEAVDVIADKIKEQLGFDQCIVRGGKKRVYQTKLNRFLKSLLTRARPFTYLATELNLPRKLQLNQLELSAGFLKEDIIKNKILVGKLEREFEAEVDNEIEWGKHLSRKERKFWEEFRTLYIRLRNNLQIPLWEYNSKLSKTDSKLLQDIVKLTRYQYVYHVMYALKNNWNHLKLFHEHFKNTSDTEKLKGFESVNFKVIFQALPIWMTTLSEVKDILPFEKEMFDVAIIDEASQCDIASCLPIIQRAKRVVFAGDQNQLRHLSFLSRHIQRKFQEKNGIQSLEKNLLNYRDRSVLDLVMSSITSGDQVAMLDEHFRSSSQIIAFSNEQFYENALKIMTTKPDIIEPSVFIKHCEGKRQKDGRNLEEAAGILNDIGELVHSEKKLKAEYCTSIGVISPFRDQVDYLAKQIQVYFSLEEISKHNILIGTAYSFQGTERDHIYLSMCVDAESHHSAYIHINKPDIFNVSITRARKKQIVYVSVDANQLKKDSLLGLYLVSIAKYAHQMDESLGLHDEFLSEVIDELQKKGISDYWPSFNVAALEIDLLVKVENHYFGIDLVGYPGDFVDAFGVERYRVLGRAGINIFPLPYSDWHFDKEKTLKALTDFILKVT